MSTQEFDVPPPGKFVLAFLLIIGVIMPIIVVTSLVLAARDTRAILLAVPMTLIFPLVTGVLGWSIYRRKIRIVDNALRTGPFGWKKLPVSDLDLDAAVILDLEQHRELQPRFKLAGTSMPGYRSGWFRLRNKRTAYALLTDWRRVLVLPKRDGGFVLLSPTRPEAVLDALRRANG
jgi:hypothetical protein